jgi:SPFH domain / Band 7 family
VAKLIFQQVSLQLTWRGLTIENVLLRHIQPPATLKASTEAKQQAEQEALAMNFRLRSWPDSRWLQCLSTPARMA